MKIDVHETAAPFPEMRWAAIDSDTYDGAPDSANRAQIGYGKNEREAVDDLVAKLLEQEGEEADALARQECGAAAKLLDHLAHSAKFYLEIDEPDGFITFKDGEWQVARRAVPSQRYPLIGRLPSLREALELAITPFSDSERRDLSSLVEQDEDAA